MDNGASKIHLSTVRTAFEIRETTEEQGEQVEALQSLDSNKWQMQIYQLHIKLIEDFFPRDQLNQEAINELQKLEKKINKDDLLYKTF